MDGKGATENNGDTVTMEYVRGLLLYRLDKNQPHEVVTTTRDDTIQIDQSKFISPKSFIKLIKGNVNYKDSHRNK